MKRFWDILVLVLALNFVALAGAVVWLKQTGRLERENIEAIRLILFPPPKVEPPATQPSAGPTTRPMMALDQLLARRTGVHSAAEQVEFIQQTFDYQMGQLERRSRELDDLRR